MHFPGASFFIGTTDISPRLAVIRCSNGMLDEIRHHIII